MLGYVNVKKDELKMREFELYSGYYCGICKSIGSRYGQLPRFTLSYDAAFLAMILAGVDGSAEEISREHCVIHHIKEKTVVRNRAIDYAGDMMLILAWYKLLDDIQDENRFYAKVATVIKKGTFKKLQAAYPDLCEKMEKDLRELKELEDSRCAGLDEAAEAFSHIMELLMTGYEAAVKDPATERILRRIGYHLGKWIYVIDAYDDVEDNIRNGVYNPLVYRYGYEESSERPEDFKKRVTEPVEWNLLTYLAEMSKAYDLLELKRNNGIIENVIYLGLLNKTEEILGKKGKEDGKQSL